MTSAITKDLIAKASDDISHALHRTISLAGNDRVPVAMSGAGVALAIFAAELQGAADGGTKEPDHDTFLLAALLLARAAEGSKDPVNEAYEQHCRLLGGNK